MQSRDFRLSATTFPREVADSKMKLPSYLHTVPSLPCLHFLNFHSKLFFNHFQQMLLRVSNIKFQLKLQSIEFIRDEITELLRCKGIITEQSKYFK